jgi:hypothetical protein
MLETQLAQLAAATPAAEQGKIPGQPESTLESVNVVNAMWEKSPRKAPFTSYAEKLTHPRRSAWGELAATIREDPRTPVISCSIFDCNFDHAMCDLGASVNIMPKVTFKKLRYPSLSPTTMCVQLADSTMRYPEGVVENLLVKVRNTFILVDFMVLDMEGDLRIPLILGRPFLRDTNARIDVGAGKISLRIMGQTMKFKFQNKRELFLIHEDSKKQGYGQNPVGRNGTFITPHPSLPGKIGKFTQPQQSQ